ncbi:MAG: MFS transporter [Candidatus Thorarchaeota archaeon]|nr:MFS transporter [Candidatus Thorarchaeota archaeon]
MSEEISVFRLRETYLMGTILGVFFAYITTVSWLPTYKAIEAGIDPVSPPTIMYMIGAIDLVSVSLGFVIGYYLARRLKKRRPLMIAGGFLAALTSLLGFLPVLQANKMVSGLLMISTIFFVCLCLCPWTFILGELAPPHRIASQMHATLLVSAVYGVITPIIQGILFFIDPSLFYWGWLGASFMLLFMGICSIFVPETTSGS